MPQKKIDEDEFRETARKLKTLSNTLIARALGIDRTTVYRYKVNNPDVVLEVEQELKDIPVVRFDAEYINIEGYRELPIIKEWVELQKVRRVSEGLIRDRVNGFFNVCKYLKIAPSRITPEIASKLVMTVRQWEGRHLKDAPKEYRGLSYYTIRKYIRSFFQLVHGISGEKLTSLGIDAGRSLGTGSMASERVTKEQRQELIKIIPDAIRWVQDNQRELQGMRRISWDEQEMNIIEMELKAIAYFMYYTGTRINSSHNIKLNDERHSIEKNLWQIHIIDKGKGGGIHWDKRLMDDGIRRMENYINERFNIPIDEIKDTIPNMDEYLFPWIHRNYREETAIMKRALRMVGNEAIQPNHIWRHTFAQDSLKATKYNYDLCAVIGGWKNTDTMKLSYGEMDMEAIDDGLKLIMNIPIPEKEQRFLRW